MPTPGLGRGIANFVDTVSFELNACEDVSSVLGEGPGNLFAKAMAYTPTRSSSCLTLHQGDIEQECAAATAEAPQCVPSGACADIGGSSVRVFSDCDRGVGQLEYYQGSSCTGTWRGVVSGARTPGGTHQLHLHGLQASPTRFGPSSVTSAWNQTFLPPALPSRSPAPLPGAPSWLCP